MLRTRPPLIGTLYVSGASMLILPEASADSHFVPTLVETAFGNSAEANLVDELRKSVAPLISLGAKEAGTIVGHICFSPVTLSGADHLEPVTSSHISSPVSPCFGRL